MTARAKPFLLTVLSGPNAGARTSFAGGKMRIGGGNEDQIILAGVPAGAMTLRADGETLRVQAGAEGIHCHDGATGFAHSLPTDGKSFETRLPATLRLNDETMIVLSRLGPAASRSSGRRMMVGVAVVAMVAGLWIGARLDGPAAQGLITQAQASLPADSIPPRERTRPEREAMLTATSPRRECIEDCIEKAAVSFDERLDEAGLDGLQLVAEQGVLRVTGTMTEGQGETWRRLRARFEADFGQSLPLISEISEGTPEPVLAVSSVWLGKVPEIRTKSGNVFRVGDTTPDGWEIRGISVGEIRMSRNSRNISVRF
ncbi:SctD/MshK family protein [Paracoccus alkanivorans]|uniref:Yop protein translocation protein D periplasmic domain-containing protein n=1 Tax=Paracoccus alkanivorans TaxID=2116655 RepID=A0A3M0MBF7_9RHOB|nr:hypothetical protein [Paracoccus alkanivorans]RMC34921.1 hypothetical protein C9E81_12595 [Paracoccus alkanivorans]